MMDPSLFLFLPVLLPGPPLPVLGQQITKPPPPLPSSTLEELPDVVPIPQSCLVVLAVLPDFLSNEATGVPQAGGGP